MGTNFRKKELIYPMVTAGIFTADQIFKAAARKHLTEGQKIPLSSVVSRCTGKKKQQPSPSVVYLYNSSNRGAAMNLLQKHPAFISGMSAGYTAMLTMLYGYALAFSDRKGQKLGLSLLLGGAYSNTLDRVRRQAVTDYLNFPAGPKPLRDVVYNLGDFAIGAGTVLAFVSSIKEEKEQVSK